MKLFTSVIPQIQHVLIYGRWFTPSIIVLFAGLEMYGRKASSDVHDTVGALVFMMILAVISIRHRANPIGWVKRLGAIMWHISKFAERYRIEFGPDLKCNPPLPNRLPFIYYGIVLALIAWISVVSLIWGYSPFGWRPLMVQISYIGYLAGMSILWGLLFIASMGGVYFPIMLLTRLARGEGQADFNMSRRQLIFLIVYLASTTGAAWYLPTWPPMLFALSAWIVTFVLQLIPSARPSVQLLWRHPLGTHVYSIPPRRFISAMTGFTVLFLTAIVMTASGGSLFGTTSEFSWMPLTIVLGNWLAWLTPGLISSILAFVVLNWLNDPAGKHLTTISLPNVPTDLQERITKAAAQHDCVMRFDHPQPNDVSLRMVPEQQSEVLEFDPKWPLAVSYTDLLGHLVYDRASRRDVIQLRRQLLKGFEQLFHGAKNRHSPGGCGYWFAPHLWFVAGLTRDEVNGVDEEPALMMEMIGPRYAEVFSLPTRQYIHAMLKGLQIDLIFLEDGVTARSMKRVWRMLFDLADKAPNGERRAEDNHFHGLTKIRVIFHDFDIDEPFKSSKYPEPKFSPLGRLRVMHVFKDRGDHEELSDMPNNFDATPIPYLVG